MDLLWIFCLFGGLLGIAAAAGNWDWFFAHPKARRFVALIGRRGARVFYGLLGGLLLLAGGYLAVNELPRRSGPPLIITVRARLPGASARSIVEAVASPIEEQIITAPETLVLASEARSGEYLARVYLTAGIGPELGRVVVQNRVLLAEPLLPGLTRHSGVTIRVEPAELRSKRSVTLALVLRGAEPNALTQAAKAVADRLAATGVVVDQADYQDHAVVDVQANYAKCEEAGVARAAADRAISEAFAHDRKPDAAALAHRTVTSDSGRAVPLGSLIMLKASSSPEVIWRVNGRPALQVAGTAPDSATAARCADEATAELGKNPRFAQISVVDLCDDQSKLMQRPRISGQ